MSRITFSSLFLFCFLLLGCPVRSLSPLFQEKDIVFNEALLGTWKNTENTDMVTFERMGDNSYRAIVHEKDKDSTTYMVQLGKLGNYWFTDWFPDGKGEDYQMIPTHLISQTGLNRDSLSLSFLEGDWVEQVLSSDKNAIPHARQTGDIILTADTELLQKFVLQHAGSGKAFPDPGIFARVR